MKKISAAAKEKKSPPAFDVEAFNAISYDNCRKVALRAYSEAVELAIRVKHGPGILNRVRLLDSEVEAISDAMAPLIETLRQEAIMSFVRVANGILDEPSLKDYLQRTTAANIGKGGGRPKEGSPPHHDWLEGFMRMKQMESGYLTAKEHASAIRSHSHIHVDSASNVMTLTMPGDGDEYTITESLINRTLTKIKARPF